MYVSKYQINAHTADGYLLTSAVSFSPGCDLAEVAAAFAKAFAQMQAEAAKVTSAPLQAVQVTFVGMDPL